MSDSLVSTNPADGSVIWRGEPATSADVTEAVATARGAFPAWAATPLSERVALARRYAEVVQAHAGDLASLISAETGKTLWDSRGEVSAVVGKVEISIEAHEVRTGTRVLDLGGMTSVTRHRPHGVMAVFGPYNFPAHLPNGHIVPALIAGNTIVFKPSEETPAVAEAMASYWAEAGLPDGVLNVVQGATDTGRALAAADIDGLLFTGSARTGALLHRQFGGHPQKLLALEMGGNNALVVMPVADMSAAVAHTVLSAYLSAGQRCTCARRLVVPEGPWGQEFVDRLATAVSQITVGDPAEEVFMGPLVSERAAEGLLAAQEKLISLGARAVVPMAALERGPAFVSPGLVDVTGVADLPDEEYFGPLLQVLRHRSLDEAVDIANDTRFGLSAGILTDDPSDWETFLSRIRAGVVNLNRPLTGASSRAPFGGVGVSGNHRPSAFYAADYCAYPVASIEATALEAPPVPTGLTPEMFAAPPPCEPAP